MNRQSKRLANPDREILSIFRGLLDPANRLSIPEAMIGAVWSNETYYKSPTNYINPLKAARAWMQAPKHVQNKADRFLDLFMQVDPLAKFDK